MKISYNWLKEYINIDLSPQKLADILTNTGLEVEKIEHFESIKGGLEGFVVGEVKSKKKHPNADKLSLTTVDIGSGDPLSIVCGAPNVDTGQKVVVATIGTTLYDDKGSFTIKKSKLRGEISQGMLCSEVELSLGSNHDGIMVLPEDTPIGKPIKELYEIEKDVVFEIGLTPNRSDAMSHIGVARDIAAALNVFNQEKIKYHYPKINLDSKVSSTKKIEVEIHNEELCPRYSSVLIDNVKVKESPIWLQNRLKSIGLKPINNIVDITNYVLKEYGQPLHAFDANRIEDNKVIIATAKDKEAFVCLDGKSINLSAEDLMIKNNKNSMCIAGVFGGANSGVKEDTTSIFLESAYFNSSSIRKTSTRHKLKTDAASRYEKGADPNLTLEALKRAASLICELAQGQIISDFNDIYPKKINPFKISFRYSRLDTIAGKNIPKEIVKQILFDLEIDIIKESKESLELEVPQYRADVQREIDVIEEIMRIYGFNNIETPTAVFSSLSFKQGIDKEKIQNTISNVLNGMGYSEILTNSISKSVYYSEVQQQNLVRLQNSMTAELDIMRANLLYDGLQVLAHNMNRKMPNLSFFEFGNIYHADYSQEEKLIFFQTGDYKIQNWKQQKQTTNFYHLLSTVQAILSKLKISNIVLEEIEDQDIEFGIILKRNEKILGKIGKLKNHVTEKHEIKQDVFYASLNWNLLLKLHSKIKLEFEEIPKFPIVKRDLALILDKKIKFDTIKRTIFKSAKKYIQSVELFDIYIDKNKIGKDKKSYAISLKLLNKEKTLIDKEIEKIVAKIIKTLEKELNANIRG